MKPAFILEVETNFQILVQSTPVISKPDITKYPLISDDITVRFAYYEQNFVRLLWKLVYYEHNFRSIHIGFGYIEFAYYEVSVLLTQFLVP